MQNPTEIIIAVIGACLAFGGGALQMNRGHPTDFLIARACFWGSGLILAVAVYCWLCQQSITLMEHLCATLALVVLSGGLIGTLLKWVTERENVQLPLPNENSTLNAIAESAGRFPPHPRPDLTGEIISVAISGVAEGAGITVQLEIRNSGTPSIADKFSASLSSDGFTDELFPAPMPANASYSDETGEMKPIRLADTLYEKLRKPIPSGDRVRGFLFYFAKGVSPAQLTAGKPPEIIIRFRDVKYREYTVASEGMKPLYPPGIVDPFTAQRDVESANDDPTFEINALAVSDLQNRTEMGLPGWCLDCLVSIHNLHPTQGVDDVRLRILSIIPPMIASPTHHPRTQDSMLRRVRYYFSDIPTGKALLGDQTGHVHLFNATRRKMDSKETAEVCVRFCGAWPDNLGKEFIPQPEHLLTVEATGSEVGRKETNFKLSFSVELDKPVLTVTRLDDIPTFAFRKRQALYEAVATSLAKAAPIQFAGLKCLQDAGVDAAILESNDDLIWICDNLVRDGYEHPFHYMDIIPQKEWLVFLTEARKDGINFADDMATLQWVMETHPAH